jgi:hypothetical protein
LLNLLSNKSFERKANENSNIDTMNGIDELAGNGYDSDNNQNDFIIRDNSDPQNSRSLREPREDTSENDTDEDDQSNDWGEGFSLQNVKFYYLNDKKERAFLKFNIEQYPFWNVYEDNDDK